MVGAPGRAHDLILPLEAATYQSGTQVAHGFTCTDAPIGTQVAHVLAHKRHTVGTQVAHAPSRRNAKSGTQNGTQVAHTDEGAPHMGSLHRSYRLDEGLLADVEAYAKAHGLKASEAVSRLLEAALEADEAGGEEQSGETPSGATEAAIRALTAQLEAKDEQIRAALAVAGQAQAISHLALEAPQADAAEAEEAEEAAQEEAPEEAASFQPDDVSSAIEARDAALRDEEEATARVVALEEREAALLERLDALEAEQGERAKRGGLGRRFRQLFNGR